MSQHVLQEFFDPSSSTLTYIVFDSNSKDAVVIDPVLDYRSSDSTLSTQSIGKLRNYIDQHNLKIHLIMETHAHADHLSGAQILKSHYPESKIAIGSQITKVQEQFKGVYNMKDLNTNGVQFDQLLDDGKSYQVGTLQIKVFHTPGHTPACASYLIGDRLFCGDALFMPERGSGRCDFPGGSAEDLYDSISEKIYTLPDDTQVYVGHDYPGAGEEYQFVSSLGEHKKRNKMIPSDISKEDFKERRQSRDQTLSAPKLLLQSIQVNIEAGKLPPQENNAISYLKIPLYMGKDT